MGQLTHASFFTGIGGFDLGFELAGIETVAQCEKDQFARQVLKHHWPEVPCHDDIRQVDAAEFEGVSIISGGFPCQGLSVAGRQAGINSGRSGLFHELVRVIASARPEYVVWENVPGLLSNDGGRAMGTVLRELAHIGYYGAWRVLGSGAFGIPQHRRRVYGVFGRGGARAERARAILLEPESLPREDQEGRETGNRVADGTGYCHSGAVVAKWAKHDGGPAGDERYNLTTDPLVPGFRFAFECPPCPDCGEPWCEDCWAHYGECECVGPSNLAEYVEEHGTRVRRWTPLECERMQGFPDGWTDVEGMSDTQRYRQCGNAVSVPVAYWIGLRAKMALEVFG